MSKNDENKDKTLEMTRSFKYKKVQEDIDDLDNQKTKEISLKKKNKSKNNNVKKDVESVSDDGFFEDIMSKKEKKNYDISKAENITKEDVKKLEKKASKKNKDDITEEDLFITQSFKPLRKRSRIFKMLKPILFLLVFSCILFGLVYFYVYPKLMQHFITPRYVFESAIDKVAISLKDKINSIDDSVNGFDMFINVNSNKNTIFNDYNYNFTYLFDDKDNMVSFNYTENEKDLGMNIYFINDSKYLNYSVNNELYNITNKEIDNEYFTYYDNLNNKLGRLLSIEDTIYFIDKNNEFMKMMLDKEYLYKESSSITVNGIKKDVVKFSLKIDSNYYKKISNAYYTFVKDDSKLLNIMSVICDKDMNEMLNYLYSNLITKDRNVNLIFDIYMVNGNEFVGTDVTINGFRSFYYYKYDENMEFYLNLSDYIDGVIKDKFQNMIFLVKGTDNGEKTNLILNYNGKDKAEINVKYGDNNYIFNYAIINSDRSGKVSIRDDNTGLILNRLSFDDEINIKVDYVSRDIDVSGYDVMESDKKLNNATNLFKKEFIKNRYVYTFDDFVKSVKK